VDASVEDRLAAAGLLAPPTDDGDLPTGAAGERFEQAEMAWLAAQFGATRVGRSGARRPSLMAVLFFDTSALLRCDQGGGPSWIGPISGPEL
jgi:hypothetical protein